jgi:uncharacterized protein (TIGR03790 family)
MLCAVIAAAVIAGGGALALLFRPAPAPAAAPEFATPAVLRPPVAPDRVVVLANSADAESLALAGYYMRRRGIPEKNLVALPMSADEEISWEEFAEKIWNPLLKTLAERKWLTGGISAVPDASGRLRLRDGRSAIGYLVLCKGTPLRVRNAPALLEAVPRGVTVPAPLRTGGCSTDSELALLAAAGSPLVAYVSNPLFAAGGGSRARAPLAIVAGENIVRVARLDGPTFANCRQLVDNALLGEKNGLAGRAYIDTGGRYPAGDRWFNAAGDALERAGFDTSRETSHFLFGDETRADAPAFYLGWYASRITGRFADPFLRFAPGAVALHLHSFSAVTLRSPSRGWTGPLVARGCSIVFGNVAEPLLNLTTRPDILVAALLDGAQAGEAAALATPAWSWQTILVGDPLYSPFRVPLDAQLERLHAGGPASRAPALRAAIITRKANLLRRQGRAGDALALLAAEVRRAPSPALRFALARAASHPSLAWDSEADEVALAATDTGLLVEIARYLRAGGATSEARDAYRHLLARNLPAPLRETLEKERP